MILRISNCMLYLFVSTFALHAIADVWYVDKDNHSGVEDGTTWQTAFTTIQPAVDTAKADGGGEVWVAEGVYNEPRRGTSVRYDEVETGTLMVYEGIALYGGFSGTEAARSERSLSLYKTIIDGSNTLEGKPAACVVYLDANSTIDGFTITGGDSREFKDPPAALTTKSSDYDIGIVIENCIFEENHAIDGHSAVGLGSIVNVRNCFFRNNNARSASGNSYFYDCIFENNNGAYSGGSPNKAAAPLFIRCIFRGNHATIGGALGIHFASAIIGCLFIDNVADEKGGALYLSSGENVQLETWAGSHTVDHCTFINNQAPEGPVLYLRGVVNAQNNLVPDAGDEPFKLTSGTYSVSELNQTGVLYIDPHFADPENGDYRLMPDSPAIDANGLDTNVPEIYTPDLAGTQRPLGANYDLGAYEYDPQADSDGDGLTNDTEWTTYHTHPYKADTDGDHVPDGIEIQYGTDPLDPSSTPPILPLAAGAALTGLFLVALWRARRMRK